MKETKAVTLDYDRRTARWTVDGKVFTSAGMALHHIDELKHTHDVLVVNDLVNAKVRRYER